MALYKSNYGAIQICLLLLLLLFYFFFDPGTQFPRKEKITLCNIKKYKNQAGMNLIIIITIDLSRPKAAHNTYKDRKTPESKN